MAGLRFVLLSPAPAGLPRRPPEIHPDPSRDHTFVGPARERALWLTYLPILPQCGHAYWSSSSERAADRVWRRRTSTGSGAASRWRWSRTRPCSRCRTNSRRAYWRAVSHRSSARR
ncbi:hypothetical protein SGPA1_50269 [Streptomyces misionensis JCM 4497]